MKNSFVIEYLNENEFRKKERAVKKYNMLAYKKLIFDFLKEMTRKDKCVIVVSHNDIINKYVDKIYLLESGTLHEKE